MLRAIQASLTVLFAIVITALVIASALPTHARSGADARAVMPDIRPAVLVEVSEAPSADAADAASCPALQPTASSCPYLAGPSQQRGLVPHDARGIEAQAPSECPYLAETAAGGDCPALSEATGKRSVCPYLSGKDPRGSCPRDRGRDAPRELTL